MKKINKLKFDLIRTYQRRGYSISKTANALGISNTSVSYCRSARNLKEYQALNKKRNRLQRKDARRKYKIAKNVIIVLVIFLVSALYASYLFYGTAKDNKDEADGLRASQNVMMWFMDESASEQIQNRDECVIKLMKPNDNK